MTRLKVGDEERASIIKLLRAGKRYDEIARETGRSYFTVAGIATRTGLQTGWTQTKPGESEAERLERQRETGRRGFAAARTMGSPKKITIDIPDVGSFRLTENQVAALADGSPTRLDPPDSIKMRLLRRICEFGPYENAVQLTQEEWYTRPFEELGYRLIEIALEELNSDGYIIYALGKFDSIEKIRATSEGFDRVGYRPAIKIVGDRRHKFLPPEGGYADMTRYYHHSRFAEGVGPIETMPLWQHRIHYPNHEHPLEEIEMSGAVNPLPEETKTAVAEAMAAGEHAKEVAKRFGITFGTAYRISRDVNGKRYPARKGPHVKGMPRSGPRIPIEPIKEDTLVAATAAQIMAEAPRNQKLLILDALLTHQRAKTVADLRGWIRSKDFDRDPHSLTHALWSMQKEGTVKFRERTNSGTETESALERIELTPLGRSKAEAARRVPRQPDPVKFTEPEPVVPTVAEAEVIIATPPTPKEVKDKRRAVREPISTMQTRLNGELAERTAVIDREFTEGHEGAPEPKNLNQIITEGSFEVVREAIDLSKYPNIVAAQAKNAKRAKIEQAARLIEESSDGDDTFETTALQLLERVSMSDLEREVIALLGELGM